MASVAAAAVGIDDEQALIGSGTSVVSADGAKTMSTGLVNEVVSTAKVFCTVRRAASMATS